MSKSIIIDATHFVVSEPTGVEEYVNNLLPQLSKNLIQQGILVSWVGHQLVAPKGIPEGVQWIHSPYTKAWSQTALLRLLTAKTPDLFFTPSGLAPLLYKGRFVITVHDLAAFRVPTAFSWGSRFRLKRMIAHNARHAAHILTPSKYTKDEIELFWQIRPERISVTPLGFITSEVKSETISSVSVDVPYFLFVSRIETKKNLAPVIEGFSKLEGAQLVLAGKQGKGYEQINAQIAALPESVRSRIILTGYLSEGQKKWAYDHALAVVTPCPVEGFGLPILEAFAANVPVLSSQAGSLPEVAGEAVSYVESNNPADWTRGMQQLLQDSNLRKELSIKGRMRLASFTWDTTAEHTAAVLVSL